MKTAIKIYFWIFTVINSFGFLFVALNIKTLLYMFTQQRELYNWPVLIIPFIQNSIAIGIIFLLYGYIYKQKSPIKADDKLLRIFLFLSYFIATLIVFYSITAHFGIFQLFEVLSIIFILVLFIKKDKIINKFKKI